MSVRVTHILGHATLQALPHYHRRKFGVPQGGAWDPFALAWANTMVGNDEGAVGLELGLCQIALAFEAPTALAWAGGSLTVRLNSDLAQGPIAVAPGDRVEVEIPAEGARRWVAFGGGLKPKPDRDHLRKGDLLYINIPPESAQTKLAEPPPPASGPLRVVAERPEFAQLFANPYTVRIDSSRVGVRLDGPRMRHRLELPSEPAVPGVIQITPEGLPILLGPDGPTIGGYPRAGVVISADWPRMAQLRPGDAVRFNRVTVAAARQLKETEAKAHADALRMLRGG